MYVKWLGTATVEIICGGKKILVDPYFQTFNQSGGLQIQAVKRAVSGADIILITHPHLDHFIDIAKIVGRTDAPVFVSERGIKYAGQLKADCANLHPLCGGMRISAESGLDIRVWESRHTRFDRRQRLSAAGRVFQPGNILNGFRIAFLACLFRITDADVFAFEISDGEKNVFLLGSANLRGDIDYPENMDCLVYPFQGRSDMDSYSVQIVDRLKPKRIILSHFDDAFPPVSSRVNTEKFCRRYPDAAEAEFGRAIEI